MTGPRAGRALDALNLFLSDVRYGLGAYLAVYPLERHAWDEAGIGVALSPAPSPPSPSGRMRVAHARDVRRRRAMGPVARLRARRSRAWRCPTTRQQQQRASRRKI